MVTLPTLCYLVYIMIQSCRESAENFISKSTTSDILHLCKALLAVIKRQSPLRQLTDEIQLFQHQLQWKQFLIFKGFLPETNDEKSKLTDHENIFMTLTICVSWRTSWVPTQRARETTRRRSFVLGPLRAFSASTKEDNTSRRCSLYFFSEITLFCRE